MTALTSIFGVAPLRFECHKKGFRISVSKPMCIYSYMFVFLLGSAALFGKVIQISLSLDMEIDGSAKLAQLVWLYFHLQTTLTAIASVVGGPTRMKNLIMHLNRIATVDKSLGSQYSRNKDIKTIATAVILSIPVNGLLLHSFYSARINYTWFQIVSHYSLNLLIYLAMCMYLQVVYIFVMVRTRFKSINDALTLVTCQLSEELKSHLPETVNIRVISEDNTDGVIIVRKSDTDYPRLMVSPKVAMRRIAFLRSSLCDIVNTINSDYGLPIVITMLSTLGNIVSSLYIFLVIINKPEPMQQVHRVIINCLWLVVHIIVMISLVEPCHNTEQEDKKTRSILCRIMSLAPPSGTLLSLLEMLGHQLMLKPASYEPLGMCVLNRPLIVTIVGAVSTYLVILLDI